MPHEPGHPQIVVDPEPAPTPVTTESKVRVLKRLGWTPPEEADAFSEAFNPIQVGAVRALGKLPSVEKKADADFSRMFAGVHDEKQIRPLMQMLDVLEATRWLVQADAANNAFNKGFSADLARQMRMTPGKREILRLFRAREMTPEVSRRLLDKLKSTEDADFDKDRSALFGINLLSAADALGNALQVAGLRDEDDPRLSGDLAREAQERGLLGNFAVAGSGFLGMTPYVRLLGAAAAGLPTAARAAALRSAQGLRGRPNMKFLQAGLIRGARAAGHSQKAAEMLSGGVALGIFSASQGGDFGEGFAFGFLTPPVAKHLSDALVKLEFRGMGLPLGAQAALGEGIAFAGVGAGIHGFDFDTAMVDALVGMAVGGATGKQGLILRRAHEAHRKFNEAKTEFERLLHSSNVRDAMKELKETGGVEKAQAVERALEPPVTFGKAFRETTPSKPSEPATPKPSDPSMPFDPVSIKNKATNARRVEDGLGEFAGPIRRAWPKVMDEALAEAAAHRERPRQLVEELSAKPRALSDTEGALIAIRLVQLRKARNKEHDAGVAAEARGDKGAAADAAARASEINDQYQMADRASVLGGRIAARGLAFRNALVDEDFTLLSMETKLRAEHGFRPLTEAESSQVRDLHKRLEKATRERDAFAEQVAELRLQAPKGLSSRKRPNTESAEFGAKNRLVTREAKDEAVANIRAKLGSRGRLTAGLDPTIAAEAAKVGTFLVEAGLRRFGDFSREMVSLLGEKIRPHLRSIWRESQEAAKGVLREETNLKALKTRRRNIRDRLRRDIEAGEFVPRGKKRTKEDREAIRLGAEVEIAKQAFNDMVIKARLKNRTTAEKVFEGLLVEAPNLAKAVITSFDLSAVLRQGGFVTLGNPKLARDAFVASMRALRSEAGQAREEFRIKNDPNFAFATKIGGLEITESGPNANMLKAEEDFASRNAAKIPGVGASQRAFVTFLNALRMDTFNLLASKLSKTGQPTPNEARLLANYVNVATGRGVIGVGGKRLQGLESVFWAPRLVASRVNILTAQPLLTGILPTKGRIPFRGTLKARRLVAQEYAKFAIGIAAVYKLAEFAGAEIEWDGRSSDFGKIKWPGMETRLDPLTGFAQVLVLEERLTRGAVKSTRSGRIKPTSGPGKSPFTPSPFGLIGGFARTKFNPTAGAAADIIDKKNVVGQPTTFKSVALSLTTPLILRDIAEALEDQGVPRTSALTILAMLGMGMNTYEQNEEKGSRALAFPKRK